LASFSAEIEAGRGRSYRRCLVHFRRHARHFVSGMRFPLSARRRIAAVFGQLLDSLSVCEKRKLIGVRVLLHPPKPILAGEPITNLGETSVAEIVSDFSRGSIPPYQLMTCSITRSTYSTGRKASWGRSV
jgi:hypothetical protein